MRFSNIKSSEGNRRWMGKVTRQKYGFINTFLTGGETEILSVRVIAPDEAIENEDVFKHLTELAFRSRNEWKSGYKGEDDCYTWTSPDGYAFTICPPGKKFKKEKKTKKKKERDNELQLKKAELEEAKAEVEHLKKLAEEKQIDKEPDFESL